MPLPLEDTYADVIGKAQRGLKTQDVSLIQRAIEALRSGNYSDPDIASAASALCLSAERLVNLARGAYAPEPIELAGLAQATTGFEDFTVNAYVLWDPTTKAAVVFDTGASAKPIIELIEKHGLRVNLVFITHTHPDHVYALDALLAEIGTVPVFSNATEPQIGTQTFQITESLEWETGGLKIQPRSTCGHSRGGVTYVVSGLDRPIAIVGDALFAGSMGGGMVSYSDALETNRAAIFSLPDNTVVCPGHGPLTSVAEEKSNNPFFPEHS
jgi:glyoxylase-like metal-dependent hydrolase (beta-lactamase superfamily II)